MFYAGFYKAVVDGQSYFYQLLPPRSGKEDRVSPGYCTDERQTDRPSDRPGGTKKFVPVDRSGGYSIMVFSSVRKFASLPLFATTCIPCDLLLDYLIMFQRDKVYTCVATWTNQCTQDQLSELHCSSVYYFITILVFIFYFFHQMLFAVGKKAIVMVRSVRI